MWYTLQGIGKSSSYGIMVTDESFLMNTMKQIITRHNSSERSYEIDGG